MSAPVYVATCPCPSHSPGLAAALQCHAAMLGGGVVTPTCDATDASTSRVIGIECMSAQLPASRGFFVESRSASGSVVCSGGDHYHMWAVRQQAPSVRFAALSVPVAIHGTHDAYYWLNASSASLPGSYKLTLSLVETQRRTVRGGTVDLHSPRSLWNAQRVCVWHRVALPSSMAAGVEVVVTTEPVTVEVPTSASPSPTASERVCASAPSATDAAYVRLDARSMSCGELCIGDVSARIFNTSNPGRWQHRRKQGYQHVIKPSNGCRLRWHDEDSLSRCLGGRSLLLTGSSYNVDLMRAFALVNRSIASWTRQRPGPTHPNVADFWRAFEKPSGSYCYRRGRCAIRFGRSRVTTSLFHYPSWNGLANLRRQDYDAMCAHDIVVLESAYEDLAMPTASGARKKLAEANASWRERPLATYVTRLSKLLSHWTRCADHRRQSARGGAATSGGGAVAHPWRALFQLAPYPRARALSVDPHASDCGTRDMMSEPHHVAQVNAIAKHMVEAAGFEVFDPSAATLHADPRWYDWLNGPREYDDRKIEPVSDLTAQLLINQLCSGGRDDL
jgi:hypothetical protein